MTHDKQLKRLSELGWTEESKPLDNDEGIIGWKFSGPDGKEFTDTSYSNDPPPIPDELLALLEPDEPKQPHTPELWRVAGLRHRPEPYIMIDFLDSDSEVIADFLVGESRVTVDNPAMCLARATRAVQCVNACAPYPDPGAHIAEQTETVVRLTNALSEIHAIEMQCYRRGTGYNDSVRYTAFLALRSVNCDVIGPKEKTGGTS